MSIWSWLRHSSPATLVVCLVALLGLGASCNLTPGDDDDDDAGDDDDTSGGVTIYDIQQGDVAADEFVTLEGVVVTSPKAEEGFFIMDPDGGPYSGLYVFTYSDVLAMLEIEVGHTIDVSGTVSEFYDMTELTVTSADNVEVLDSGATVTPEQVTTADLIADYEPWESVLIETSGTVTAGVDNYGQWAVDGVLVDDMFYHAEPQLKATVNHVIGPLFYEFEQFKIMPRMEADVDVEGGVTPDPVTIYDIQQGNVTEDTVVLIEDVVVSTPLTQPYSSCEIQGFWIQETAGGEYSGINVIFWLDTVEAPTIAAGDTIESITALYQEAYDHSNLILQDENNLVISGSGPAPAPEVIADPCAVQDWEPYEGVLTQIQDLTVTGTIGDIGYGSFEVDSCLLVDSKFFEYTDCGSSDETPDPPMGQEITSITGPIKYTYEEWRIDPTGPAAFEGWTP